MPVTSFAAVRRMSGLCGTAIPRWMATLFDGLDDRPAARQLVAATVAADLCRRLYAGGVRHFHFYTLNRAELSYAICHLLGLRPKDDPGMTTARTLPRRSGQAHPDHRRRVRHRDPELEAGRGRLCRRARPGPRPEGQQRHPRADPARRARIDPPRLFRGRRGHRRDQHLLGQSHQPGRLRRRTSGARDQPRERAARARGWPTSSPPRMAARASSPGRSGRPTRRCRFRPTSTTRASARSTGTPWSTSTANRPRRWSRAGRTSS